MYVHACSLARMLVWQLLMPTVLHALQISHLAAFKADITEMTLQMILQCILECLDSSVLLRHVGHFSQIWMGEATQLPEHRPPGITSDSPRHLGNFCQY